MGLLHDAGADSNDPGKTRRTDDLVIALDRDSGAAHDRAPLPPARLVDPEAFTRAVADRLSGTLRSRFALVAIAFDGRETADVRFGAGAGDDLLAGAAARLLDHTRTDDIVTRSSAGGFNVLLVPTSETETAESALDAVARRLVDLVSRPYPIGTQQCYVHPTYATVLVDPDSVDDDAAGVLDRLRSALVASRAGLTRRGHFICFTQREKLMRAVALAQALRETPTESGFELHYQPIVDLGNPRVLGIEALLRWRHPSSRLITTGEFIRLADETGLLGEIGSWAVRHACHQLAEWRLAGVASDQITMSVNVSTSQLCSAKLGTVLDRSLDETGLPPHALCLEINEASLSEPCRAAAVDSLRTRGVSIAIDDFGVGASSLRTLVGAHVSVAKIDRSLIARLPHDERTASVVRGVVALSRSLGFTPMAEGIETREQAAILRRLGCLSGQGFLYARPMPADRLTDLLASQPA